ncbi:MAG: BON domain-containing protein [Betaproteobacteria bacterium]|jgi:osmotically-inducible protein OsmY|nr:MAG: BON domain-containing protein [Betaproteobacteria bacterium]
MKFASWLAILAAATILSLQGCAPVVVGAGVGAGVMIAEDRRSSGIMLEDQVIERQVSKLISQAYEDQVRVSVTSYNRVVLLVGQAPSEESKKEIGLMALGTENVRTVQNEIAIAGASSFVSRSSDALLTSKVKSRLLNNDDVGANHVKVVTNNDTVYLMGLVTRAEADAATRTAATTSGVQRVVKVFEYLD